MNQTFTIEFDSGIVSYSDLDTFPSTVQPDEPLCGLWSIAEFMLMYPSMPVPADVLTVSYEPEKGVMHVLTTSGLSVLSDSSEHPTTAWVAANMTSIRADAMTYRMAELEPA